MSIPCCGRWPGRSRRRWWRASRRRRARCGGRSRRIACSAAARTAALASVALSPSLRGVVRREFAAGRANLLHVHAPNPWGDLAALDSARDTPVVMTWHSDVVGKPALMTLYRRIQQRALQRADRIVIFTPRHLDSSPQLRAGGHRRQDRADPDRHRLCAPGRHRSASPGAGGSRALDARPTAAAVGRAPGSVQGLSAPDQCHGGHRVRTRCC